MAKIEMRNDKTLWITFEEPNAGDPREVIIDKDKDVRFSDGKHVVKITFDKFGKTKSVLVDDVVVFPTVVK